MLNKMYGRGVCDALQKAGLVKFANEKIAMEAADAVSEAVIPEEAPEMVGPEQTAALADNLMELSQALETGADHAAAAAEEAAKSASANADPAREARVKNAAAWLRQKMASPPPPGEPAATSTGTGATITGKDPDQQNEMQNTPNTEARLDEQNRPGGAGYANVGVEGVGSQEASGQGAIGSEKEHPGTMGPVEVQDSNSAIEAIKGASLQRLITKLSEGTTLMPDSAPTADAATGEGKLDDANRPGGAGYANKGVEGVGKSDEAAKERAAAVGTEGAHPGTMGPKGQDGTNTAIQQIPNTKQSEAQEAYLKNFQEVADKYAEYMLPSMSKAEKVAALRYLLGQDPTVRDKIAFHLQKHAAMPEGLAQFVAKEKGEAKEEGEEKGEKKEKKEEHEEKKEDTHEQANTSSASDVLSKVRQLIANA